MSIEKFASDLERFELKTNVNGNRIDIDFNEIQISLEVDEEWSKAIKKVYRAKQYELDFDSKYQVSNLKVEFQIIKLTTSYVFKPCYEFSDKQSNKVVLSDMSKEYMLNLFRSKEYSIDRFITRIKRRYSGRFGSRMFRRRPRFRIRFDDLFINFNTITYQPKIKKDKGQLISIGREKCKACLFKLSVNENECWELRETIKGKGYYLPISEEIESDMTIPKTQYEDDLVGFYKIAKSSLFPSQAFLSYYHVLEYNFLRVSDEELHNRTKSIINSISFNSNYENINKLLGVLKKHEKNLDETSMLRRVLDKYIDERELIDYISEIEKPLKEKVYSKPKQEVFGEKIPIRLEDGHVFGNTAKVIKHIRNSLVHSSDKYTREECVVPFSESESIITRYISIVKFLAEKVIYATGK